MDTLALRLRLTGRGLVAVAAGLVLLVAGVWWRYPGLVVLGVGLLAATVMSVLSLLLPAPVVPRRQIVPLQVTRMSPCTGTLRVRSAGRRFAVSLDAVELVGDSRVPIEVARLGPGEESTTSYTIPTVRRGIVSVGPLRLNRLGTAGLAVGRGTAGGVVTVHVLPRVLPVAGLPAGVARSYVGADERVEHGGTDLRSLREYVPGDDLRRLHWATTARSGTLMIREDADPARPYLAVMIDDRASSYTDERFEDAVEVTASLIESAVLDGHPVRLMTLSGGLVLEVDAAPTGTVPAGAAELLAALSCLQPVAGMPVPAAVPTRELDVVATVTGTAAALAPLLSDLSRATVGVALVVGADPALAPVESVGSVTVLRGARAEDLLARWDETVA